MTENPFDNPERFKFAMEQREKYGHVPDVHHSVEIPIWVKVGYGCTIHEGVLFTEGFGYVRHPDMTWLHIPHAGRVILGDEVDIYPYTTVNRGTVDSTIIGEGTKIDHHCHIGHNSRIGRNCIICAGTVIAGSVVIGDNVWIGPGCKILNKVKIADDCFVGEAANVVHDIDTPHSLVKGNPARSEYREFLPHIKVG